MRGGDREVLRMGIAMDTGGATGTGSTMATGQVMHVAGMPREMPIEILARVRPEGELQPEIIPGLISTEQVLARVQDRTLQPGAIICTQTGPGMYTNAGAMATGNKRGIQDSNQVSSGLPVPTRTGSGHN